MSPPHTASIFNDPTESLPKETFTYILSFLPPPSLVQCALVSRNWNELCTDKVLWRSLATRLEYCQLDRVAEERRTGTRVVASVLQHYHRSHEQDPSQDDLLKHTIERYRSRNTTNVFDKCDSWRQLCCRLWQLSSQWLPSRPTPQNPKPESLLLLPKSIPSPSPRTDSLRPVAAMTYLFPRMDVFHTKPEGCGVWRCKLDPEERTIVITCENGGVQVFDHATKKLLWHIPRTATRSSPHLEFSRGWLIFDRLGQGHFEVWRSERLVPDLGRAPDRGHYQRFTILSSSRPILAYRFQFPYLCAASRDGFITIWDVPQQKVVETIPLRGSPHSHGNITYVDFDDDFVFLTGVGAKCVSVFSRSTQEMAWNMGQYFAAGKPPPTTWHFEEIRTFPEPRFSNPAFIREKLVRTSPGPWQAGPSTMNMAQETMTPFQMWSAIHPDLKTKTLLVLGQGTLLLIRDYTKLFKDANQSADMFVEIEFDGVFEYGDAGERYVTREILEDRATAQLTVHEGKAVVVNGKVIIFDMNVKEAELHVEYGSTANALAAPSVEQRDSEAAGKEPLKGQASSSPTRSTQPVWAQVERGFGPAEDGRGFDEGVPPILVYSELYTPVGHSNGDNYADSSSVQMDDVSIYVAADQETMPQWLQEKHISEAGPLGNRSLLRIDFSRRDPIAFSRH
ncbi:uncharacterized protein MEPE_03015 [Melanopsichium pennsylvanicum]|uniref:F-box domain-containing protein n=2 Tax=Melanopsichium pennsylvanicum TaxID=63383 RepID=A0AAJ4XLT9_9BASI|nr:putative protein [Melanopsichium pennsylvanicum 4]SNX84306.1 uncharacterized protein MEPE_03015 [Melanopsichium pennsylvanicum]